ncbi:hypothetical protein DOS58_04430 [Staphylococcus felis]|uniref:hypothetical protein n=1 Tax=Staphylococcus felis TaxID=46127 RepID=UPI000E28ADF1|nr:hypothetical protein [Staphylococcus felis]REH90722.1 hypothetical protein DOS58_04430 [Staphylococcus felis]
MQLNYGNEVKERGNELNFKHPEKKAFGNGKTLGTAYEKGTIENECSRQSERIDQQTQSDRP